MSYVPKDIFNADECGLFYCLAPDTATAQQALPGRKKAKHRITVMPCASADGTEKIELMVIGHSVRPRCIKKKTGRELGFDYHANKKAWMTATLFFEWLKRLERYIARTPGRKVVLLIDNCSAHGTIENMPELTNMLVLFLPLNCTSKIQPMNAGIIASLKVHYRRLQMEHALYKIDAEVKNIYKVDLLVAMRWFKKVWMEMPALVICNCWQYTLLLKPDEKGTTDSENDEGIERGQPERSVVAGLEATVRDIQCATSGSRIAIEHLLNSAGENDGCTEVMSEDALVGSIIDFGIDEISISEEEVEDISLPSAKEQLKVLAICKQIAAENDATDAVVQWIRRNQAKLRYEVSQSARQSTIDQFFN